MAGSHDRYSPLGVNYHCHIEVSVVPFRHWLLVKSLSCNVCIFDSLFVIQELDDAQWNGIEKEMAGSVAKGRTLFQVTFSKTSISASHLFLREDVDSVFFSCIALTFIPMPFSLSSQAMSRQLKAMEYDKAALVVQVRIHRQAHWRTTRQASRSAPPSHSREEVLAVQTRKLPSLPPSGHVELS